MLKVEERLLESARVLNGEGDAEIDEELAPLAGNVSAIEDKIADLQMSLGIGDRSASEIARWGAGIIDIMIEMVQDECPFELGT